MLGGKIWEDVEIARNARGVWVSAPGVDSTRSAAKAVRTEPQRCAWRALDNGNSVALTPYDAELTFPGSSGSPT